MKQLLLASIILLSFNSHAQDLPKNPKPGECYVRCVNKKGKLTNWKTIDCDLVKFQTLPIENIKSGVFSDNDKKIINDKILKFLKEGYKLQIKSHFDSDASEDVNSKLSIRLARQLVGYLFTACDELKSEQVLVNAFGDTKPIEKCNDQDDCSKVYSKNTRIEFRFVNEDTE